MKIAVNTRFLLPRKLEGLGWYTHEIVRRMVLNHPEDEFVFFFDRPFEPQFIYGPNVRPMVLFPPSRHPVLWYAWFEHAVPTALKKTGADVFFSPDSYLSLSSEVPTLMTTHDIVPLHIPEQLPFFTRHYYQYYLPRFLRRANHVVTVSDYVRRDIIDTVGLLPEKVSVVGNGCRTGFVPIAETAKQLVRNEFSQGQPYFFYTGAIHPRKNIPRLLRAFDTFKQRTAAPAKLLLAGRFAWQTGEVRTAYEQAQHRADIQFLGYVPEDQLVRLMAAATALTYLSISEGFGLPPLEAMYCDTPVLAADATALPEVCGDAALLVNPFSEEAIANGLETLWKDTAFRQTLLENGRQQRLQYSWDRAAEAIYTRLCSIG